MVKLTILIQRRPGMSQADFHNYWRNHHATLYHHAAKKYVRKYVLCHTIPEMYADGTAQYDGIAELWFDSVAASDEFFNDPEYTDLIHPDEPKFVDVSQLIVLRTIEEIII